MALFSRSLAAAFALELASHSDLACGATLHPLKFAEGGLHTWHILTCYGSCPGYYEHLALVTPRDVGLAFWWSNLINKCLNFVKEKMFLLHWGLSWFLGSTYTSWQLKLFRLPCQPGFAWFHFSILEDASKLCLQCLLHWYLKCMKFEATFLEQMGYCLVVVIPWRLVLVVVETICGITTKTFVLKQRSAEPYEAYLWFA